MDEKSGIDEEQNLGFDRILHDSQHKADKLWIGPHDEPDYVRHLAHAQVVDRTPALGREQLVHQGSLVVRSESLVPDDSVKQRDIGGDPDE